MAWVDQCHVAFRVNAEGLLRISGGKKKITRILKEMAEESGIPWKTLYRWWQEYQVLKNEKNEVTPKKDLQSAGNQTNQTPLKKAKDGTHRGGKRKGAGRKPKARAKKLPPEEIVSEDFQKRFDNFLGAITDAKHSKWKTTSKEAVLHYIDVLYDVTNF